MSEPRAEVKVEIETPNKNLLKNHPANQINGSKDKWVMKRNKVQIEELCLIFQFKPKSSNETSKDDFWIKDMREELD